MKAGHNFLTKEKKKETMSETYKTNTKVQWDWGNGTAEGYIREVFREKVTLTIKDTEVTRNGSDEDPA